MGRPKKSTSDRIFQMKLTVRGIKPPIWRRLLLPAWTRLDDLHELIQEVMLWDDYHLHRFIINQKEYGIPHRENVTPVLDEGCFALKDVVNREGDSFFYNYDFGDDWEVEIVLEKILSGEAAHAQCLDGQRAAPPEDCGGPHGYSEFLEARAKKKHPRLREMLSWYGKDYDPESFDVKETNRELALLKLKRSVRKTPRPPLCEEVGFPFDDPGEDDDFLDAMEDLDDILDPVQVSDVDPDLYNPDEDPDPEQWREVDEVERLEIVESHHYHHIVLPTLKMHTVLHVTVENQLAEGDEVVVATLRRLMNSGLDRHNALHAICSVLGEFIFEMMQGSPKEFPEEKYYAKLRQLKPGNYATDFLI